MDTTVPYCPTTVPPLCRTVPRPSHHCLEPSHDRPTIHIDRPTIVSSCFIVVYNGEAVESIKLYQNSRNQILMETSKFLEQKNI